MNNNWVITDTHIGHDNILKYCRRPTNHAEILLENLIKTVKDGDTLFHLGDVIFGDYSKLKPYLDQVKGSKVLILGNHDRKSDNWYRQNGFDVVCSSMVIKGVLMTHEPKDYYGGCYGNLHGHIHNRDGDTPNVHSFSPHHYLLSLEWANYAPVNFDKIQAALLKNYTGRKP